jgi:multisubunit Na+/H+ antiporter MnhF subunit
MIINTILFISLILIIFCVLATIYRIVKGPSSTERIQALDALGIYIIAGVAVFSILQRSTAYFEVEFSSLIAFEAEDEEGDEHEVEVDLLFILLRTCNGVTECVQTWRYLYEIDVENDIDELEVEISEPFTVTFCDRACPGCCEYKMVVEGKDFEGEFEFLRVTKPELSALAQGECDD